LQGCKIAADFQRIIIKEQRFIKRQQYNC